MPKKAPELSAAAVRRLSWGEDGKPRYHAVGGVSGLLLQCRPPLSETASGSRSWILRTVVGAKRRDIGLGGYPDVSLADARESAREMKAKIKAGIDPVAERKKAKQALIRVQGKALTFEAAARTFIEEIKAPVLSNPKHLAQWSRTLEDYVFPYIGKMGVGDIETAHIVALLQPIWQSKTETATRVRGRIANVLDWAISAGYRDAANPAALPLIKPLLADATKLKKAKQTHMPALGFEDAYRFMQDLRGRDTITAIALDFLILTAARPDQTTGALWSEIDLKNRLWCIPENRMKKSWRTHTVALNDDAMRILENMPRMAGSDLVFNAVKGGKISGNGMINVITRMHKQDIANGGPGYVDKKQGNARVTAHGFRTTFGEWARRQRDFADEISELALSHVNSDETRAAYKRDAMMDERARLMRRWGEFLRKPPVETKGQNVVDIERVKA
ncbi:tyrosine-type recombinase/integrase [Thalassospira lohafexi]|uniref:Integrase n=1 Tax=Thalassospira lohafexi TaxID=744227 RepID=A0A2N3LBF8_9PROT|nr:integrase arm-type DNA-binding domain-containing protein [Thalassospira lohafexi]PKR60067.1 integrase [Thalassospira lohafexi]